MTPDVPHQFTEAEPVLDEATMAELQQIADRYPQKRSGLLPMLHLIQSIEGRITPEGIEACAQILDITPAQVSGVATFYTMFQLAPVGRKAHVQVCGTTPCMLRGSEALIAVCKSHIAPHAHELSADGNFSWEEVECLGSCANAPMVQINDDNYEDLDYDRTTAVLEALARGETPPAGSQIGRRASCPEGGPTTLKEMVSENHDYRGEWA